MLLLRVWSRRQELMTFLKAMNRQTKTDESSFGNSNCLPVLITMSAEDYVHDLFRDPGEDSQFTQGFVHGDVELTRSSSHEHDSILWMSWPLSPSLRLIFISGLPLVRVSLS